MGSGLGAMGAIGATVGVTGDVSPMEGLVLTGCFGGTVRRNQSVRYPLRLLRWSRPGKIELKMCLGSVKVLNKSVIQHFFLEENTKSKIQIALSEQNWGSVCRENTTNRCKFCV